MPDDPAQGVDGWLHFGLCSYLLGQNDWTSLAMSARNGDSVAEYAITAQLGVPASEHAAIGGDPYFRYRLYNPTTDGGSGGVVVVNANTSGNRSYAVPFDAIDEQGSYVPAGTTITLKPNSGRVLTRA